MQFQNLLNECVECLKIQFPFSISIKHKSNKWPAQHQCWTYSTGKRKHKITVWLEAVNLDGRNMETVIAHEFIHAWQEENGYLDEIHGKAFRRMAKVLEKYLKLKGFPVDRIYIKGTDKP